MVIVEEAYILVVEAKALRHCVGGGRGSLRAPPSRSLIIEGEESYAPPGPGRARCRRLRHVTVPKGRSGPLFPSKRLAHGFKSATSSEQLDIFRIDCATQVS